MIGINNSIKRAGAYPARFFSEKKGYRYQFTGHSLSRLAKRFGKMDGETGYQYHGARYYNEELGRYMSTDRFAEKFFHQSPYVYAGDMPISAIDENGDSVRMVVEFYIDNVRTLEIYTLTEKEILERPDIHKYIFIDGLKESYNTPIGKETLDKIINSSENDLYIGEYTGLDKKQIELSGGDIGATFSTSRTKQVLGEDNVFDINRLDQETLDRGHNREFKLFNGVQVTAKNNYFVMTNSSYSINAKEQAEVIFHEIAHVDLFIKDGKTTNADDHHRRMGQTFIGSDSGNKDHIMTIFRQQLYHPNQEK